MRKLILGAITQWPNTNSFRFVDETFAFPNLNNAFVSVFPEMISFTLGQVVVNADFEAIPVGDINGSSFFAAAPDDRFATTQYLEVTDASVVSGSETVIQFKATDPIAAAQFTLDMHGLEILHVDLPSDQFHLHANGTVTVASDALNSFSIRAKGLCLLTSQVYI